VVFKRRDKRPMWKVVADVFWPKGGWARAFRYIQHRLRRLPDPPHRIARGIFAGIFVTFTPFFGLHLLLAVILSWAMRGNVVAALLATFFGNPLTFVPIAAVSLQTGYYLLGMRKAAETAVEHTIGGAFVGAGRDLKHNLIAVFTDARADWSELAAFYNEVFLPYMIGGLIPGAFAGLAGYYVSLPLIQAYQNRRKGALRAKWVALREKAAAKADGRKNED